MECELKMKTKLVYVLTCAPEATYIEQALMSVWSAKYHNPDAHIVLLTDDKTDYTIANGRDEILNYIDEKIVIPFAEDMSMMIRSRWIKTSVRNLVDGDYLFIDCDTIITKSLGEIDSFSCKMGAVLDSMLPVAEYCDLLYKTTKEQTQKIGVDLDEEPAYFNGGLMYVKDVPEAHEFYSLWHQFWNEGMASGLFIDEPALAKANRQMGRIIKQIPNHFNFMVWTRAKNPEKAYILHISSYQNPSFLFTDKALNYIKTEGLTDWIKDSVLNPCDSMLPFDYSIRHSSIRQRFLWRRSFVRTAKDISNNIPLLVNEFFKKSSPEIVMRLIHKHCYAMASVCWMTWKRLHVLKKSALKDNICRK